MSRVGKGPAAFDWRITRPKTAEGVRTITKPTVMTVPMRAWLAALPVAAPDGLVFTGQDTREPLRCTLLVQDQVQFEGLGHLLQRRRGD